MITQVLQVLGALLILVPYALAQAGRLSDSSRPYLASNLAGGALLAVLAGLGQNWGFLVLEAAWALVSLRALVAPKRSRVIASAYVDRVRRGAALLDCRYPGWRARLRLPVEVSSPFTGVLGQLYGAHAAGARRLGLDTWSTWWLGFGPAPGERTWIDALQAAWSEVLGDPVPSADAPTDEVPQGVPDPAEEA